jgi:hypothetical protein
MHIGMSYDDMNLTRDLTTDNMSDFIIYDEH